MKKIKTKVFLNEINKVKLKKHLIKDEFYFSQRYPLNSGGQVFFTRCSTGPMGHVTK